MFFHLILMSKEPEETCANVEDDKDLRGKFSRDLKADKEFLIWIYVAQKGVFFFIMLTYSSSVSRSSVVNMSMKVFSNALAWSSGIFT